MENLTLPEIPCFQKQTNYTPYLFIIIASTAVLLICYGLITQVSVHVRRLWPNAQRQDRMDQTIGETRIRAYFPSAP